MQIWFIHGVPVTYTHLGESKKVPVRLDPCNAQCFDGRTQQTKSTCWCSMYPGSCDFSEESSREGCLSYWERTWSKRRSVCSYQGSPGWWMFLPPAVYCLLGDFILLAPTGEMWTHNTLLAWVAHGPAFEAVLSRLYLAFLFYWDRV